MKVIHLMNLSFLLILMVNPILTAPPRSSKTRPAKTRNRSPFSKSLVKGIQNIGSRFISRKKKPKKAATNGSQNPTTSNAIRDAVLDVGGQLTVAAVGGKLAGAGAIAGAVSTAGEVYTTNVSIIFPLRINKHNMAKFWPRKITDPLRWSAGGYLFA